MSCPAGLTDADYTLNALMRSSYETALQLLAGAQLPSPLADLARKGFIREGKPRGNRKRARG
jgi:hypothetical protein